METQHDTADAIRDELQRVRRRLLSEANAVAGGARELADWRYYVRRFPWGAVCAAGALGYLAVPRRLQVMSPDVKTLEQLAKRNHLVVETKPASAQKSTLADSLLTMAGNVLLRAGVAYVGQQMGRWFEQPTGAPAARQGSPQC